MIWTAGRVLLIVAALAMLSSVALYVTSSDGTTQFLLDGIVLDVIAIVVLVASASSLWRDRKRT